MHVYTQLPLFAIIIYYSFYARQHSIRYMLCCDLWRIVLSVCLSHGFEHRLSQGQFFWHQIQYNRWQGYTLVVSKNGETNASFGPVHRNILKRWAIRLNTLNTRYTDNQHAGDQYCRVSLTIVIFLLCAGNKWFRSQSVLITGHYRTLMRISMTLNDHEPPLTHHVIVYCFSGARWVKVSDDRPTQSLTKDSSGL